MPGRRGARRDSESLGGGLGQFASLKLRLWKSRSLGFARDGGSGVTFGRAVMTALLHKLKEIFASSRAQPIGGVIDTINPILRGWVKYFAVGHSSRCFSYIRDWVEKADSLMTTECTQASLRFHALCGRQVRGGFDGGTITSDGGGLLLREVEHRAGPDGRLACPSQCRIEFWLDTTPVAGKQEPSKQLSDSGFGD